MQQNQRNKGQLNMAGGSKGGSKPGGGKGFTKLLVGIVCAAAVGGFLWMKSPSSAPVQQAPAVQSGQQQTIAEVPGTVKKGDLAQMLAKAQAAQKGTEEAKAFDEAKVFLEQIQPVLNQAFQETQGPIVILADTSGSMWDDALKMGMVNALVAGAAATRPVSVVWVDDAVRGVEQLTPGVPGHPVGGGGTSLRPGFDYLAKQGTQPGLVISITDGHCMDLKPTPPGYPVLWVLVRGKAMFHPTWGTVTGW